MLHQMEQAGYVKIEHHPELRQSNFYTLSSVKDWSSLPKLKWDTNWDKVKEDANHTSEPSIVGRECQVQLAGDANHSCHEPSLTVKEPLSAAPDGAPPSAEPAKAKASKKPRDPRTASPAIAAVHALMDNRNPPTEMYDRIIAALGEHPDEVKLRKCRQEWVDHGFNRNSWIWLLDWYVNGIPATMTRPHNRGPSPPSPPSRPLTGGSWRSPLTGEEHYEGKPKHQDTS
jgi:hypothetical protein